MNKNREKLSKIEFLTILIAKFLEFGMSSFLLSLDVFVDIFLWHKNSSFWNYVLWTYFVDKKKIFLYK